jgi:hypothetical protein
LQWQHAAAAAASAARRKREGGKGKKQNLATVGNQRGIVKDKGGHGGHFPS